MEWASGVYGKQLCLSMCNILEMRVSSMDSWSVLTICAGENKNNMGKWLKWLLNYKIIHAAIIRIAGLVALPSVLSVTTNCLSIILQTWLWKESAATDFSIWASYQRTEYLNIQFLICQQSLIMSYKRAVIFRGWTPWNMRESSK